MTNDDLLKMLAMEFFTAYKQKTTGVNQQANPTYAVFKDGKMTALMETRNCASKPDKIEATAELGILARKLEGDAAVSVADVRSSPRDRGLPPGSDPQAVNQLLCVAMTGEGIKGAWLAPYSITDAGDYIYQEMRFIEVVESPLVEQMVECIKTDKVAPGPIEDLIAWLVSRGHSVAVLAEPL